MDFLNRAKEKNLLKIIKEPLDVNLEIPHVAYIEAKKENSKILLFENPVDKIENRNFKIPVLMNTFANYDALKLIFGKPVESIADEIENFLKITPPKSFKDKISLLKSILKLKNVFPKRKNFRGSCQQIIISENEVNLDILPILKTWERDAGKFITAGQVYTISIDGKYSNVGLYRLQKISKNELIIHWQIHKDGANFYHQYKNLNKKMPVSIAIGGDPLYLWCAQAPLPPNIFELLLYGFIKNKNPVLVKSITNEIYIPHDVDIVIEGEIDPENFADEGPFGDHTGYYTPVEKFPVMKVKAITMKKNPIYNATVVGKPPVEDKFMVYATEKIFLPLLKTSIPDLIDYHMPEAGVFHNLLIAKVKNRYPGEATQIMHALWGLGQMSFLKHPIIVDENAPDLRDYKSLVRYILNRMNKDSFIISKGIVDQLDHSSYEPLVGGKLGIDATNSNVKNLLNIIPDDKLLEKFKKVDDDIVTLKQYFTDTQNPITFVKIRKRKKVKKIFDKLKILKEHIKILIFVDNEMNDLNNLYMLTWRVTNNIDALNDVWIEEIWGFDATKKTEIDGYFREWPEEIFCSKEVIDNLMKKGIIEINEKFIKKYYLLPEF